MDHASFAEFKLALEEKDGRAVTGNYGLAPRLGKYYHTTCEKCGVRPHAPDQKECHVCGHTRMTKGVSERLEELADQESEKERDLLMFTSFRFSLFQVLDLKHWRS